MMKRKAKNTIKSLINPRKQQNMHSLELDISESFLNEKHLVPGYHPINIEVQIIKEMKRIALLKSQKELWDEACAILKKILEVQKSSLSSEKYKDTEIANTLYLSGLVLSRLECPEAAILDLKESVKILSPDWKKRKNNENVDLANTFYELALVYGRKEDYIKALHYLDHTRKVEIHMRGFMHERTNLMICTFERRLNKSVSRDKAKLGKTLKVPNSHRRRSFVFERQNAISRLPKDKSPLGRTVTVTRMERRDSI